jgi:molybdopterin synthase sulfur carrier subunit
MVVRVRLFAAAREAAGTGQTEARAGSLPAVLDELCDRFGPDFARRLEVCSILVDGQAVRRGADAEVPDGAEVAILPPVSGGAGPPGARHLRRGTEAGP